MIEEHKEKLDDLERILGYRFKDRSLLLQSLLHRSYVNERGMPLIESNERLEFLGDSVIELSVTHLLFEDLTDYREGDLTKLRATVVGGRALAAAARRMGLAQYVLLGKGEELTGGRQKDSILADAFEALVAALYLDAGFDAARGMVISLLESTLHEIVKWGSGDSKSLLQEISVKKLGTVPRYSIAEEGPDHYKTFHATVQVGDSRFGPVPGTSKKEAEQGVAWVALKRLGWEERSDG